MSIQPYKAPEEPEARGNNDNGHFNSVRILRERKQKKSDMTFD